MAGQPDDPATVGGVLGAEAIVHAYLDVETIVCIRVIPKIPGVRPFTK